MVGIFSVQAAAQQGKSGNDADEETRQIEVAAGPMVGWRHFRAQQGGRNALHLDSPMIGGGVDAQYKMTHDESSRWSTLVTTGFSYAPIQWSIAGTAEPTGSVSGHHAAGHLDAGLEYTFGPGLAGQVLAGAGVLSEWTEANSYYSGSRYIGGRVHAGVSTQPTRRLEVDLFAGVLPSPWVQHSGGSRGQTPWALGWSGHAACRWSLTRRIGVTVDYNLIGYDVTFDTASSARFETLDFHHRLGVRLSANL
jgi:hypothetical protein